MSRNEKLLRRAIDFIHEGKRQDARQLLFAILREDQKNELAWKWVVDSYTTSEEKRQAYEKWHAADPNSRVACLGIQESNVLHYPVPPQNKVRPTELPWLTPTKGGLVTLFIIIILVSGMLLSADQPQVIAQTDNEGSVIVESSLLGVNNQINELQTVVTELDGKLTAVQKENAALEAQLEEANILNAELEAKLAQEQTASSSVESVLLEKDAAIAWLENQNAIKDQIIAQNNMIPGVVVTEENIHFSLRRVDNNSPFEFSIPYPALVETNSLIMKNLHYSRFESVTTSANMTGPVMDYLPFMQQSTFVSMMADLEKVTVNEYDLMQEAWYFVSQLTLESDQIMKTPQYPLDTLVNLRGDLEDKAILLATLLKAADVNWEVSLLFMDYTYPTDPHAPNYIMVRVEHDGETYDLDPAGQEMSPFPAVDGWPFVIR